MEEKMIKISQELIDNIYENTGINIDNVNLDEVNNFDELVDALYESGEFDIEVIYDVNAMRYLLENDPRLTKSLGLAKKMGFELDKLNSEILASLLKSNNAREEFEEYREQINAELEQ